MTSAWFVQDRDDLDLTAGRGIAAPLGELAPGFNPTGAYLEATVLPHGRLEVVANHFIAARVHRK